MFPLTVAEIRSSLKQPLFGQVSNLTLLESNWVHSSMFESCWASTDLKKYEEIFETLLPPCSCWQKLRWKLKVPPPLQKLGPWGGSVTVLLQPGGEKAGTWGVGEFHHRGMANGGESLKFPPWFGVWKVRSAVCQLFGGSWHAKANDFN